MRILFAGTPEFAAAALSALLEAGHQVALVLTQPDRPAGRGLRPQPSPVKRLAQECGLPVFQPTSLKPPEAQAQLASAQAESMVVAAYGLLLPQAVLDIPPRGCINIHASLLPRWRGAAPIQRALLAGDAQTGISIMQMDAGLDTGPVLLQEALPIAPEDTAHTLHDKLAALGARLIVEALSRLERGELVPVPQPEAGVTYAEKIRKEEAVLDWRRPALELERQVRAFDPFPVAHTTLAGETLRVWRAELAPGGGDPGEVIAVSPRGVTVACGEGALTLTELQKAGGRRLAAASFLAGHPVAPGQRLG